MDSLTSAVIAEKLVDAIKNNPDQLENSIKEVVPLEINSGSVRGKPEAVTGQKGELLPTEPSPSNTAPRVFNTLSLVFNLVVFVLYLL